MDSDSDSIRSLQSTQSDLEDEQFNELYDLIDLNAWTYNAFSNRGCDFAGNLRSIIRSESSIKLEYDLTDLFIFSRTKIEHIYRAVLWSTQRPAQDHAHQPLYHCPRGTL